MYSDIAVWGKREFSGIRYVISGELTIKEGGQETVYKAGEYAEYLERHQDDLPPALRIELERRSTSL
jgi:hypothetical protein